MNFKRQYFVWHTVEHFPVISEKIDTENNNPAGVETTAEFFLGINVTGQLIQNKNNY